MDHISGQFVFASQSFIRNYWLPELWIAVINWSQTDRPHELSFNNLATYIIAYNIDIFVNENWSIPKREICVISHYFWSLMSTVFKWMAIFCDCTESSDIFKLSRSKPEYNNITKIEFNENAFSKIQMFPMYIDIEEQNCILYLLSNVLNWNYLPF